MNIFYKNAPQNTSSGTLTVRVMLSFNSSTCLEEIVWTAGGVRRRNHMLLGGYKLHKVNTNHYQVSQAASGKIRLRSTAMRYTGLWLKGACVKPYCCPTWLHNLGDTQAKKEGHAESFPWSHSISPLPEDESVGRLGGLDSPYLWHVGYISL